MLYDFQKIVKIMSKIYVFYGFLCLINEKKIINIDNLINGYFKLYPRKKFFLIYIYSILLSYIINK